MHLETQVIALRIAVLDMRQYASGAIKTKYRPACQARQTPYFFLGQPQHIVLHHVV
jgi:hypothetical protein